MSGDRTIGYSDATASLSWHAHPLDKPQQGRSVHRAQRILTPEGDERRGRCIGGCEVGQLHGTTAKASGGSLACAQEAHHICNDSDKGQPA